ncbi:MAG: hypothetical protein VX617_05415 [Pseudomonadota bacterium]|nr:hypothetical protein [Pseudomonadota bacterium]
MANIKRVSVIVTGLLRNPDIFIKSLDEFKNLEQIDEIIFVTWKSEAAKHSSLLSNCSDRFDLMVAAVPEPQEWSGNLLGQMLALYVGLGRAKKDNYILKTRTDVYLESNALRFACQKDLSIALPSNFSSLRSPFDEKICIWGVEATVPFYFHDLFFFGCHSDISRLVNMDIRYDILYKMTKQKIHIRRFLHPFIYEFPIFEQFLHVEHVLGNTEEFPSNYRYYVLEKLLEDDLYILILALYYRVAGLFYTNDWGVKDVFSWKDVPEQVEFEPGQTLSQLLMGNNHLKALLLRGDSLFEGIANRSYGQCPVGIRFNSALDYLDGLTDIRRAGLEYNFDIFIERVLSIGDSALAKLKQDLIQ